ncbi:Nephrocystin-1 [Podochytrium sp. JEL0797]|nr:Nephrocystin-1 [Podochytrium sp. JEL0797]
MDKRVIALYDYSGTTDEELDISKDDVFVVLNNDNNDWWYVKGEDDDRREGYVPKTYVAFVDEDGKAEKGEEVEDRLTVRIKENMKRASMDAKGRKSMSKREDKVLSKTLCPIINSAGSGFTNLAMDPYTKRLASCPVQCTIGFSLIEAKNIDPLIGDRRVLGRHVRMALFDNSQVLSNVHSIPGINSKEVPNVWRFSSKASLLFPKDDENTCFLRSNDVDIKLCILFELCALVEMSEKKNKTDIIEVSVGWGMLPLFTSDGTAIENKSYDIRLYSGSPYSKEAFAKEFAEKKTLFQTLIHGNKHPRLNIKVWKLGQSVLDEIKLSIPLDCTAANPFKYIH